MNVRVIMKPLSAILNDRSLEERGAVQRYIDSEVLRLCQPYVPRDLGILIGSGAQATVLGSGEVKYNTPYARRCYYKPANFQGAPTRGNFWFERMKNEGGAESILSGVKKKVGVKQ